MEAWYYSLIKLTSSESSWTWKPFSLPLGVLSLLTDRSSSWICRTEKLYSGDLQEAEVYQKSLEREIQKMASNGCNMQQKAERGFIKWPYLWPQFIFLEVIIKAAIITKPMTPTHVHTTIRASMAGCKS